MNTEQAMRDLAVRQAYDEGTFEPRVSSAKIDPFVDAVDQADALGFKLTDAQRRLLQKSRSIAEDLAQAQAVEYAARMRANHYDRDREAFDANAVVEAGGVEGAQFWSVPRPDVEEAQRLVSALKLAQSLIDSQVRQAIMGAPDFIAQVDDLYDRGRSLARVNDEMTVREQKARLAEAQEMIDMAKAFTRYHGVFTGWTTDERKAIEGALRADPDVLPTVGRLRRSRRERLAAEQKAEAEANRAEQGRLQAEAAQAARDRTGRALQAVPDVGVEGEEV